MEINPKTDIAIHFLEMFKNLLERGVTEADSLTFLASQIQNFQELPFNRGIFLVVTYNGDIFRAAFTSREKALRYIERKRALMSENDPIHVILRIQEYSLNQGDLK